jgi:hypothetical protein
VRNPNFRFFERIPIAMESFSRALYAERPSDDRDSVVTRPNKMAHTSLSASRIVQQNRVSIDS